MPFKKNEKKNEIYDPQSSEEQLEFPSSSQTSFPYSDR